MILFCEVFVRENTFLAVLTQKALHAASVFWAKRNMLTCEILSCRRGKPLLEVPVGAVRQSLLADVLELRRT